MSTMEITRRFACYDQYPHGLRGEAEGAIGLNGIPHRPGHPFCPLSPLYISAHPLISLNPFPPIFRVELRMFQWPARLDAPSPLPPRHPHLRQSASPPPRLPEERIQVGALTALHLHPGTAESRSSAAPRAWHCVD